MTHTLYRAVAIMLSVSLLGQNALLAQTTEPNRPSLAQVQEQAKQDRNWIQKHGPKILIGWSVLSTAAVVKLAIDNRALAKSRQITRSYAQKLLKEREQAEQHKNLLLRTVEQDEQFIKELRTLNNHRATDLYIARAERDELAQQLSQSEKTIRHSNNKIEGLTKSRNLQIARREAVEKASAEMERAFALRIETLNNALQQAHRFIDLSTAMDSAAEQQLKKYSRLFDKTTSPTERNLLRAKLETEEWFKAFSKAEQTDFLAIVDEMIKTTRAPISREGGLYLFATRTSQFFGKYAGPSANYLRGLGRTLLNKSSLLSVGILLAAVTLPAVSANAKTNPAMAKRIENNFDLFLNATPDELKELEQYEDVYEACVTAAAVQHLMTQLTEEENQEIETLLKEAKSQPKMQLRSTAAR